MRNASLRLLTIASLLASAAHAAPATHVGIVTGLSGGDYRLSGTAGTSPLAKGAKLFPGDVVGKAAGTRPPDVMWWPNAGWKDPAAAERLEVELRPPASPDGQGLLEDVRSFMGFVESDYASVHGVSDEVTEIRREERFDLEEEKLAPEASLQDSAAKKSHDDPGCAAPSARPTAEDAGAASARLSASAPRPSRPARDLPRPGLDDTLIPGVDVEFRAAGDPAGPRRLVFRAPDGTETFRRDFTGRVRLKPEAIGLPRNETWSWEVTGGTAPVSGRARLLAPAFDARIKADLKALQAELSDALERKLRVAAYLQFLSDTYPDRVSLYWLSLRMLDDLEIPAGRGALEGMRAKLRARALDHFRRGR